MFPVETRGYASKRADNQRRPNCTGRRHMGESKRRRFPVIPSDTRWFPAPECTYDVQRSCTSLPEHRVVQVPAKTESGTEQRAEPSVSTTRRGRHSRVKQPRASTRGVKRDQVQFNQNNTRRSGYNCEHARSRVTGAGPGLGYYMRAIKSRASRLPHHYDVIPAATIVYDMP